MEMLDAIAAERQRVADLLDGLDEAQWEVPSLCAEWSVREVAAHLTTGWNVSRLAFAREMLRHRGFDGASTAAARRLAERPTGEIVADLRANARNGFKPPVVGLTGQLVDAIVHGQDIARPLGIELPVDPERAGPALALSSSRRARFAFSQEHLAGVRLETTDQDWGHGEGPVARGDTGSVLLVLLGRPAGVEGLDGPGADRLREAMR